MDGLLVDTEPMWRNAEVKVFTELGVPMQHEECRETMGLRLDEAVRYWFEKKQWKSTLTLEQIGEQIVEVLVAEIRERAEPKDGVPELMAMLERNGIRMCIASGSNRRVIQEVIDRIGIASLLEFYRSAEVEQFGKPHPAIYHSSLKQLGLPPEATLVFEDSPRGVLAAKAAGIRCIGVPDEGTDPQSLRDAGADLVLRSLREFPEEELLRR